jgi:uncharacterized phage-like protein YoqJ
MILGVTGHRPTRLAMRRSQHPLLDEFAVLSLRAIGPAKVITGMQKGWDQAIARACRSLGIPYIAALPWEGFDEGWNSVDRVELEHLLKAAVAVHHCYPAGEYSPKKLHGRNMWIVDNSNQMLALWDGYDDGGTAQCVRYARKQNVLVQNVWLGWREYQFAKTP